MPPHEYDESQGCWKTLSNYQDQIRAVIEQSLVDIVLFSASNLERLGMQQKLFRNLPIIPTARANGAMDVWAVRGGKYASSPSRHFRTATIDHIKYGELENNYHKPFAGADLGLYSITFTNDLDADYEALKAFREFRIEAEQKKFRYFLEVLNPNVDPSIDPKEAGRPLFLKIPYNDPGALEELAAYDPNLVVGIHGGSQRRRTLHFVLSRLGTPGDSRHRARWSMQSNCSKRRGVY